MPPFVIQTLFLTSNNVPKSILMKVKIVIPSKQDIIYLFKFHTDMYGSIWWRGGA